MSNRRFTFLGLEITKLHWEDLLFIVSYASGVLLYHLATSAKDKLVLDMVLVMSNLFFVGTTHFGLRFKSLYFSGIWLLLSLLLLVNNLIFAACPLTLFICYHIIRSAFWIKYSKEFIPYDAGRGKLYRYRSVREGRAGGPADKIAMKILITISCLLFLLFFSTLIGQPIP